MPEYVRITDVSPRDGLQNEPGVIPTADKVRLVEMLCEAGVDEVEVTSFVSAKWVPQLGDAAEVLQGLAPPPRGRGLGGGFGGRRSIGTPPKSRETLDKAKRMRQNETEAEKAVWTYLSDKKIEGVKFRRQHPFGPFILDFYSADHLLAVEIDGSTHAGHDARQHDERRTAYLNHHGVRVVRFTNDEALRNARGVAETIRDYLTGHREMPEHGSVGATRAHAKFQPSPQPPPSGRGSRKEPLLSVLVPNERGMQSAIEVCRSRPGLLGKVSVFTAASEAFAKKNTNATIAETIERFRPVIELAHTEHLAVRGYVSCVIACPFEGVVAPAKVAEVCGRLQEAGVDELDLGDTIGAGTPETVEAMLEAVDGVWAIRNPPPNPLPLGGGSVTLHLHDTFGRAAACVTKALDMGVRSFDGSVAGLGGCPYASVPGKRAPGNIDTLTLIETILDEGYYTGVDLDALDEAAEFAREIVAKARTQQ